MGKRTKKWKRGSKVVPRVSFPVGSVYKKAKPSYSKPTIRHGSQTYVKRVRLI